MIVKHLPIVICCMVLLCDSSCSKKLEASHAGHNRYVDMDSVMIAFNNKQLDSTKGINLKKSRKHSSLSIQISGKSLTEKLTHEDYHQNYLQVSLAWKMTPVNSKEYFYDKPWDIELDLAEILANAESGDRLIIIPANSSEKDAPFFEISLY